MKVQDRIKLFMKRERYNPDAYEVCPRFDKCSVNRCPLHKDYSKLEFNPSDKEKKCRISKSIRHSIGLFFKLKNQGLTERELSGKRRWDNLTPEKKELSKNRLVISGFHKRGIGNYPQNKTAVKQGDKKIETLRTGQQELL